MSFSASSSTITQSGTDANLSSMSGVSGVTVNTIGSTGFKIYTITRQFRVNGTLTIDPFIEMLVIDNNKKINCEIRNGGRLNLGAPTKPSAQHASGVSAGNLSPSGFAMICGSDGPACCSNGAVRVRGGGTLAMYGAAMVVRGVINIDNNSNFISRDGKIVVESPSNIGNNVPRIRVNGGGGVDIIGLQTHNTQFDILTATQFANFEGYDGRNIPVAVEASPNASNSSLRGTRVNVRNIPDFRPYAKAAVNNWRGAQDLRVFNSEAGSATLCVPDQVRTVTTAGRGSLGARIFHEAKFTVVDENGIAIEGARIYCRDTDNGARVAITTTGSVSIDETSDRIYNAVTNAQGKLTHTILTAVWYRRNDVQDIPGPDGNEQVDIRGKTNTAATDDFDFHVEAYGYLPTSFEAIMNGKSAYERTIVLRADTAITETDKSVVTAYTELDTAEKLYDVIKAKKADDPTFAALGDGIVTRNGKTLDFGDHSLLFLATTPAIADNAGTLDISVGTDELTANIRTTNDVRFVPGAGTMTNINGFVADSNGTSSIVSVSTDTSNTNITAYAADGTRISTASNLSEWTLRLTAIQSRAGIRIVCVRAGYAPKVRTLDASSGGAFNIPFGALDQNLLPSGAPMRTEVATANYSDIAISFGLTDLTATTMTITLPNRAVRVQQAYEAVERAIQTDDGQKFIAFGGKQVTIDLNPTAGDTMYLNYGGSKLDAGANSPNAQIIGNVWHPDGQPIVGDGTNPTIASGVSLSILSEAISRAVLWRDIDPNTVGDQSLAGEVLSAARTVTDATHGNEAIKTLIDQIPTQSQSSGVTLTQLQTVRDAIITGLRGTNTDATLTGIASDIDGLTDPATETELTAAKDAILAAINPDIDGTVTRNEMLRRIACVLTGNAVPDTDGVAFRREDGQTTEIAYDVSDDGTRTRRTV